MNQIQYMQVLRDSQEIKLRDKLTLLQTKAHDYVVQQMKQLELKYKSQLLLIVQQYEECKLTCEQLRLKNEQYSKLILEQEFKSIQTKNYMCLEIVNQLLTQKINSLLLQLKSHNIISESEYFSHKNNLQLQLAEIFINPNHQEQSTGINPLKDTQKQIQIASQNMQYNSQFEMMNNNLQENPSIGTQTNHIKQKKQKPRIEQKIQIEEKQSLTPNLSKELLEYQKSIQKLQKSRDDLQVNNEFLKTQNQNLQSRLNQKINSSFKCNHNAIKNTQIIKKFLKFDDMVFKNVSSFQMAQSFDLRQGNISSRKFFTRPKSSAPSTTRNRCNSTQQPSSMGFHVLF
ncbi:unnamed protein product (macronuclear) [Paramecium tetraurelia]|uniref:Uncharacterized protein n=1 Tax=Paramecium tetraurelia TaxID=5888 RepID=A0CE19_PARTE|nr:uncharacterized protein GSPATT00007248001 [Paramecium tetraurelia]CAK69036.1 unnamed protein product [Paramecium tetraurelia]|eukprot:XP_001436433.1 hypothetical protein (macronuclear) [Paramecium tetraurelia strain d4-2]